MLLTSYTSGMIYVDHYLLPIKTLLECRRYDELEYHPIIAPRRHYIFAEFGRPRWLRNTKRKRL